MEEKEISIFDYLPKFIPILDAILIVWVALLSPQPLITTSIHICMPLMVLLSLMLFRKKGRWGFYLIGIAVSTPQFFLNFWGSVSCPTWLPEFSFIAGGLLLTTNFWDRFAVLLLAFGTTFYPLWHNHNSLNFIFTIMVAELSVWFLLERSVNFMTMQSRQIKKQKDLVEEKQKEILDSIHYAKRIQKSLLPTEKYIDKNLDRLKK